MIKVANYPAMASPESVRYIAESLSNCNIAGDRVLDPFCGTGRLLHLPRQNGSHSTGIDCSPLAILIARVSHQRWDTRAFSDDLKKISKYLEANRRLSDNKNIQYDENITFWFPKSAFADLELRRKLVDRLASTNATRRIFWLALAITCRQASYIRETEYKLHRMQPHRRSCHRPNVGRIFQQSCKDLSEKLSKQKELPSGGYRLVCGDIMRTPIANGSYDIAITSPPYGDSRSTVGYGQFARIPLMALSRSKKFCKEFRVAQSKIPLDSICLGGGHCPSSRATQLPTRFEAIDKGPMRKFLVDYFARIEHSVTKLRERATFAMILADRTHQGKRVPLISGTIDFMSTQGFSLHGRKDRYLTWKRLPRNMGHKLGSSNHTHAGMNYESTLIFRR